jgi:hypothetical protein
MKKKTISELAILLLFFRKNRSYFNAWISPVNLTK